MSPTGLILISQSESELGEDRHPRFGYTHIYLRLEAQWHFGRPAGFFEPGEPFSFQ